MSGQIATLPSFRSSNIYHQAELMSRFLSKQPRRELPTNKGILGKVATGAVKGVGRLPWGRSGGQLEERGAESWGGVECWFSPLERTLVFLSEIPSPLPDVSPSPDYRKGGLVPRGSLLRDGGFRCSNITGHKAKPSAVNGTSPHRSL